MYLGIKYALSVKREYFACHWPIIFIFLTFFPRFIPFTFAIL